MVLITSDKVYENLEWSWGYRENDILGGADPYSASKAAAEILISSYFRSYFSHVNSSIRVAIARAGNVIGGGDWAKDRIVPDIVRAWSQKENLEVRKAQASRPWQHVLEPLGAYLCLAASLDQMKELSGEAFNFGPLSNQSYSVLELIEEAMRYWPKAKYSCVQSENNLSEASRLKTKL